MVSNQSSSQEMFFWEFSFSSPFWETQDKFGFTLLNRDNYSSFNVLRLSHYLPKVSCFPEETLAKSMYSSPDHAMLVRCNHMVLSWLLNSLECDQGDVLYIETSVKKFGTILRNDFLKVMVHFCASYNIKLLVFVRVIFLFLVTQRWKRVWMLYRISPTYALVRVVLQRSFHQ